MKERTLFVNTLLAAVVAVACLAALLVKSFAPAFLLPDLNLTEVVALALIALAAEAYLAPGQRRNWIATILLGAVTLALLPWCAGLVTAGQAAELLLWGGATFAVTLGLYTSITRRLASGPAARVAPLTAALGLYLAAQCFIGIFF